MTVAPAVIDLDLPVVEERARSPRRRRPSVPVLAGVVLALLAVLGADRVEWAPRFDRPVTIALGDVASFGLTGEAIYTVGAGRLTAYTFAGRQRWSVAAPDAVSGQVQQIGDTVLLTVLPKPEVIAFDAATGAQRWRRIGWPVWRSIDNRRMALSDAVVKAADPVPETITVLDAASGTVRRSFVLKPDRDTSVFGYRDETGFQVTNLLIGSGPNGSGASLVDLESDRTLALPGRWGFATLVGGQLVGTEAGDSPSGWWAPATVWDATTLDPLWTFDGAPSSAEACWTALCVSASGGTVAYNPVTGAEQWRTPLRVASGRGDRLLAGAMSAIGPSGLHVVDARTGRVLRSWADRSPMAATGIRRYVPSAKASTGGSGFELEVLDLDRLTLHPVSYVTSTLGSCEATAVRVACPTGPRELTVWRYAPGT